MISAVSNARPQDTTASHSAASTATTTYNATVPMTSIDTVSFGRKGKKGKAKKKTKEGSPLTVASKQKLPKGIKARRKKSAGKRKRITVKSETTGPILVGQTKLTKQSKESKLLDASEKDYTYKAVDYEKVFQDKKLQKKLKPQLSKHPGLRRALYPTVLERAKDVASGFSNDVKNRGLGKALNAMVLDASIYTHYLLGRGSDKTLKTIKDPKTREFVKRAAVLSLPVLAFAACDDPMEDVCPSGDCPPIGPEPTLAHSLTTPIPVPDEAIDNISAAKITTGYPVPGAIDLANYTGGFTDPELLSKAGQNLTAQHFSDGTGLAQSLLADTAIQNAANGDPLMAEKLIGGYSNVTPELKEAGDIVLGRLREGKEVFVWNGTELGGTTYEPAQGAWATTYRGAGPGGTNVIVLNKAVYGDADGINVWPTIINEIAEASAPESVDGKVGQRIQKNLGMAYLQHNSLAFENIQDGSRLGALNGDNVANTFYTGTDPLKVDPVIDEKYFDHINSKTADDGLNTYQEVNGNTYTSGTYPYLDHEPTGNVTDGIFRALIGSHPTGNGYTPDALQQSYNAIEQFYDTGDRALTFKDCIRTH